MKKVFSIVFLMLFITFVISISKFSQTRSLVESHREHTEQIDCGTKLSTQFNNFNLLSVDENKSESEIFTFDCDLFVRFLIIYFHQTFYQKISETIEVKTLKSLPKYILFHSLQIDYK